MRYNPTDYVCDYKGRTWKVLTVSTTRTGRFFHLRSLNDTGFSFWCNAQGCTEPRPRVAPTPEEIKAVQYPYGEHPPEIEQARLDASVRVANYGPCDLPPAPRNGRDDTVKPKAAITPPAPSASALQTHVKTNRLHYNAASKRFTVDASCLGWPASRFAPTVAVESTRTGKVVTFVFNKAVKDQDGDLVAFEYTADDLTLTIWND